MAHIASNEPAQQREMMFPKTAARRDVLVVCPNQERREEFGEIFERHGLRVGRVEDCRSGIAASFRGDVPIAVIIPDFEDHYTGALINALRGRDPKPGIWLIGSPSHLHLSEIVFRYEVVVMPPAITPVEFEKKIFA